MAGDHRVPPYRLRLLGALALLGVGALHIDQYYTVHYRVVPVIGSLFFLNFVGAVVIALALILPIEQWVDRKASDGGRVVLGLLAISGITLAVTSGVFLLVSEQTTLLGFVEHGYRTAIVLSLIAEGAAVGLLGTYLLGLVRRPSDPAVD